jgi:glycosyltransferase involved in cell wall biosynthesis
MPTQLEGATPADEELSTIQEAVEQELLRNPPKIVAAIPCFNEDRFIGSVVTKAKKHVDMVIVIDDGSTDGSAEVASECGAVVFRHRKNLGYGAAVCSALEKGRELGVDVMVILDGDGQHDPGDIPAIIRPILEDEADVVVGSRFMGRGEKPPLYRRLGQRILNIATNLGAAYKLTDSQSGFRAFSARALGALHLSENGMSISSEMQFALARNRFTTAEVPIAVSYAERAKRSPIGHGYSVLSRVFVLLSLRNPMALFGIPGFALLAGGLVLGTRVLSIYSDTRELALGTALGAILLCLSGLLAMFTALILKAMKELLRGGAAQLAREVKGYSRGNTFVEDNGGE